ncbi:MAG: hypothetical protein SWK76_09125 [Actinomycetota bacterium]|nr:hypothetical protein [Actinomycetota bacterium]
MLFGHIDSRGFRLCSRITFSLNIIGSRYEQALMGLLGKTTDAEWIYRHRLSNWAVDKLANHVVIPLIRGGGRILTGWGCHTIHGFLASYCHCMSDYCVPLHN